MDKYISIDQYFGQSENANEFIIKKSFLTGIILIIAAIVFIILNGVVDTGASGFLEPLFITVSIVFFISGILTFVFQKKIYIHASDNQPVKVKKYYFNIKERDRLVNMLNKNVLSEIGNIEKSSQDTLTLRIAYTENYSLCLAQVMVYIPYEFVNVTDVIKIPENQVVTLVSKLK